MEITDAKLEDMELLGHIMTVSFHSAFSAFVSAETLDVCAQQESCTALLKGIFLEGKMLF